MSAAFSPDGRFVVTASQDGTARVWGARAGQGLVILRGHTDWVYSAAFSPDGHFVITASQDGTARIYACEVCRSIDDLLILVRDRVTRELTCREGQIYLHESVACPTPTPKP
jgi:WD40 repeat protein